MQSAKMVISVLKMDGKEEGRLKSVHMASGLQSVSVLILPLSVQTFAEDLDSQVLIRAQKSNLIDVIMLVY